MNIASLDLNLLRVFDAMMLELSTVRAGERIGLSQPAVSSALGRLRHIVGDDLFVRDGNRMLPTPRAVELSAPIRRALLDIEDALSANAAFDPAVAATAFMLVGSDYFSSLLMPGLAARAFAEAPSVTLQMIDHPPASLFGLLADGKADLGVDRAVEVPEWILRQKLFRSHLACVARAGHPALAARGIRPGGVIDAETFCALPHVLRSADGGRTGTIDPALGKLGLARQVAMTVPHFHAVALTVSGSDLIGSLPVDFATLIAPRLGLDLYEPPVESPAMDIYMYWHRRMDRDAASLWLRRQVASVLDFRSGAGEGTPGPLPR